MTEICRICLKEIIKNDSISAGSKLSEHCTVLQGMLALASIQVLEADPLPQFICNKCYLNLDELYCFRNVIISSDQKLKALLTKPLTPIENHKSEVTQFEVADITQIKDEFNFLSSNIDKHLDPEPISYNSKCEKKNRTQQRKNKKSAKIAKQYNCTECQKTFKKADHLNVHIDYRHTEKRFKCEICNKKFARKYDLTYHLRVHTGEKPFTCELCGKSFASSSYFYVHHKMHTGLKKVQCDMCENSFTHSNQLQIHIRQKHTGERPYLCELCSVAFASSSALFRHKKDVHETKVECPVCLKLYSRRVLKEHIKRHQEREEGIKRFSCDQCGKKFTCATSRKRHMVIHSGEKAYKCQICEKAFNQRSTLQTHMRIHSQIMPYQCATCEKSFRYKHHLKSHFEKKHHKNDVKEEQTSDLKSE